MSNRKKAVYEALRRRLHRFAIGAPESALAYSILETLFTGEEAVMAASFPELPVRADFFVSGDFGDRARVEALLEGMAGKGLIYSGERKGEKYFALIPVVPGIFELQFMKGETTALTMELAKLFEQYYYDGWGKEMAESPTPYSRVIMVEKQIPFGVEVFPYEQVSHFVQEANYLALTTCSCRHKARLLGHGCGAPAEDMCMLFGPFAMFCVARGFAREATPEEVFRVLDRAEEEGLVHITGNVQKSVDFICNCCGCCCGMLAGITKMKFPWSVAHSNFILQVKSEDCAGCKVCIDRCQVQALAVVDGVAAVDGSRCIGCGVCTHKCPTGALAMVQREELIVPKANLRELQAAIKQEKGKLP